jgi:glycosyltransferase involved in cell wall biosynthesis
MVMFKPKYSIIIPVYNRPLEVDELLESLTKQTFANFEVVLVEDGSSITCEKVFEKYADVLKVRYFFKANSGPGPSRNFGFEKAKGDYFIVFDSDCIIPPKYLEEVETFLKRNPLDAWGGPDRAHQDFTSIQKAMGYTMSSFLTTGGIRGGKSKGFQPRSFNMGLRNEVFQKTGGFKFDRFAEDIEFSIRMTKAGFKVGLIPEAYVFHKRRTDFRQFYKQVFYFGKGRALVGKILVRFCFFNSSSSFPMAAWCLISVGLCALFLYNWFSLFVNKQVS